MEQKVDTELFIGPKIFARVIKGILNHFIEMRNTAEAIQGKKDVQMNIELLEVYDSYLVQVTNCSKCTSNTMQLLNSVFFPLSKNGMLPDSIVIASIFTRTAGEDHEIVYDVQKIQNDWILEMDKITYESINFPRLKEYMSIKLQYKLSLHVLQIFKQLLLSEFAQFRGRDLDVKITFHSEMEIFHTDSISLDLDFKNCQLLSSAMVAVIRQSMNEEFKEACQQILRIDNVHDARKVIMKQLLLMIHGKYMTLRDVKSNPTDE